MNESERLIEYYGGRIVELLERLLRREEQGLRVRTTQGQLEQMKRAEWDAGKRAIVDRLSTAENGCTVRDLVAYLESQGHHRFAANLARANLKRKSPLRELVAGQLAIRTQARPNAPAVYWSRQMYLRRYAQYPDDFQRAALEAAITEKADNE